MYTCVFPLCSQDILQHSDMCIVLAITETIKFLDLFHRKKTSCNALFVNVIKGNLQEPSQLVVMINMLI